LSAMYSHY